MLQWSYYTYWSGLPVDGFEIFIRPDRGWAAVSTNDGLTMLVVGWPYAESSAYKADPEANYLTTLELGSRVRRPGSRRRARGSVPRWIGAQLLPQAVRPGLGPRRRCRVQQGPDHRAGGGIAIHGGEVVAGIMGAGAALNKFTVTGDPINVASRVEGLTSVHKVDLLITEEVRSTLDDQFRLRRMPATLVKGKPEPIVTYYVEDISDPGPPAGPVQGANASHAAKVT